MSIFILFWLLPTFFLTTASPTEAQQTSKIFRIGFLDASTASSSADRLAPFWQEMRKLGWIEGSNMIIESRFAEEKGDRLPELAAELVRLKVDIIVGASTAASLAAKRATTTIPIVMTNSSDPVGAGLVASLGRPGGNVTGLSGLTVELNTKRLEVLKDTVPKLDRVGLLRSSGIRAVADDLQMKEFRAAAVALNLKLEEIETKLDPQSMEYAFHTAKQKQADRNYGDRTPLFHRKKKTCRVGRQIPTTIDLLPTGLCRRGRPDVLRGGLR